MTIMRRRKRVNMAVGAEAPKAGAVAEADWYPVAPRDKSRSNSSCRLLVYGVKLFARHKKASSWCQHVLVDE